MAEPIYDATSNQYIPGFTKTVVPAGGTLTFELGTTDVVFTATGTRVIVTGLPTVNPAVAGALWNNAGVLSISAG